LLPMMMVVAAVVVALFVVEKNIQMHRMVDVLHVDYLLKKKQSNN
jgi:hypothetical protein